MYTGYFAQSKKYIDNGLIPISISLITPHWFKGESYIVLAPSSDLIQRYKYYNLSIEEYIFEYTDYLTLLDPNDILRDLSTFGNLDNLVLCCYEKTSDFCHRHLVADWLSSYINIGEYRVQ